MHWKEMFFEKTHDKYMYAKVYRNTSFSFKLMESCKMKELCTVCVCCGQNSILENWMLLIYVLYVDRKCKAVVSFLLGARDKIMCDSFGCVLGGVLHKITLTLTCLYIPSLHAHTWEYNMPKRKATAKLDSLSNYIIRSLIYRLNHEIWDARAQFYAFA